MTQRILSLFMILSMVNCIAYRSLNTDNQSTLQPEPITESAGVKIEWKTEDLDKEESSSLLFSLFMLTAGVIPAYATRNGEVQYFAIEPDGTRHLIEKDEAFSFIVYSWLMVPGIMVAPFFDSLDLNPDSSLKNYLEEKIPERLTAVKRLEATHQIHKKVQLEEDRLASAFKRLLSKGGKWSDYRRMQGTLRKAEQRKRINIILNEYYYSWLKEDVRKRYRIDPDTMVYWQDGKKWGEFYAMFLSTLPYMPNKEGLKIDFVSAHRCEGGVTYGATHCYQINNSGKEMFILFRKQNNKFYIVGFGSGIQVNPYNWEKSAAAVLYRFSTAVPDWNTVTNPKLLNYRIKPD